MFRAAAGVSAGGAVGIAVDGGACATACRVGGNRAVVVDRVVGAVDADRRGTDTGRNGAVVVDSTVAAAGIAVDSETAVTGGDGARVGDCVQRAVEPDGERARAAHDRT